MIAGVPGAGITGIFYILLAACMPLREAWRLLLGRHGPDRAGRHLPARWKTILLQLTLAACVLASLSGEYWLIKFCFSFLQKHSAPESTVSHLAARGTATVAPSLTLAPFIVLTAIILLVHTLRLLLPKRRTPPPPPMPHPDPLPLAVTATN